MKKNKLSKVLLFGASAILLASLSACDTETPSPNIDEIDQIDPTEQKVNPNKRDDTEPASNSTEASNVILESNSYTEGAYLTFNCEPGNIDKAFVSYYTEGDRWRKIDDELIRYDSSSKVARADILGLKAGTYKIKADNGTNYTIKEITVSKDDRSGYAHFNNTSGIGAYKNDGSLKDNAIVVYVNDKNKNTVKATINGTEQTGLVNIIKAATSENESLDIRILGEIQTQQWNSKTHGTGKTSGRMSSLDSAFAQVNWEETTENELKNPGMTRSSNYYKIDEADIKRYGINSMSEDEAKGITHLDGLTNNVLKDISKSSSGYFEYDSYYNELDVKFCNNITVEGVGTDAKIFQWGFCFNQCNSIEVKNLEFSNYPEDGVGIQGANSDVTKYSDYWIHNCTFNSGKNNWDVSYENDKNEGDGSTDFKSAHDLTISYCRYNNTHKTALVGSSSSSYQYNVTFHHNYYNTCGSRLPFTRNTNFHIYNCYYKGSTGTNMQIQSKAYAFIEGCYFENTKNTFTTSDNGVIKLYKNTINSTSAVTGTNINYVNSRTELVTNSCKPDNKTDYSTFDTNKALFYYDDSKNISKVDLMIPSDSINTYVPTVAGAGLLAKIDYSLNTTEQNGAYVDPSTTATYNASANAPTSAGLYYTVLDNSSPQAPMAEANVTSSTTVKENNGKITITDTSAEATTIGYYIFESTKKYTSGTHTYTINVTLNGVGNSWYFLRLLNGVDEVLQIGTSAKTGTNKTGFISYQYNGTTTDFATTAFTANTTYNIVLTINYDSDTANITIGNNTTQITSFDVTSISGIKFFTAKTATDRSFTVNSITIA